MNIKKSPLAMAIGTTLFSGLATVGVQAESMESSEINPFAMNKLSSGYMYVAKADKDNKVSKKMQDGGCGEGKCGIKMMPKADLEKTSEGKCAGNKAMPKAKEEKEEKKEKIKDMQGQCGEGRCGANMQ